MMVVAPATADLMARFAHGLANDILTTLYLAFTGPVVVVPAMLEVGSPAYLLIESGGRMQAVRGVTGSPTSTRRASGRTACTPSLNASSWATITGNS